MSLNHDAAGTSDDSGRASERLNGPIVNRDRDSSHDRLSDVSIDRNAQSLEEGKLPQGGLCVGWKLYLSELSTCPE